MRKVSKYNSDQKAGTKARENKLIKGKSAAAGKVVDAIDDHELQNER